MGIPGQGLSPQPGSVLSPWFVSASQEDAAGARGARVGFGIHGAEQPQGGRKQPGVGSSEPTASGGSLVGNDEHSPRLLGSAIASAP